MLLHLEDVGVDVVRWGPPRGLPVLLVPGLGASPAVFQLQPRRPLTVALSEAGLTPWLVDFRALLRGRGGDVPALARGLFAAARSVARAEDVEPAEVSAVGHSLGGMLLFGVLTQGMPLRRLVGLASGLDFRQGHRNLETAMSMGARLRPHRGGIPLERLTRAVAPLYGHRLPLPFQRGQFHPGASEPAVVRRFMALGTRDIPLPLLADLAALFTRQGFRVGPTSRPLREAVAELRVPTLLIGGVQDRQCPIASLRVLAQTVTTARLVEVGAQGPGYGHVDLLSGRHAPREVFRPVLRFLLEDT